MIDDLTQSVDREGRLDEAVASYLQAAEGGGEPPGRWWQPRPVGRGGWRQAALPLPTSS